MMRDTIYREDAIKALEELSACEDYGVEIGTDEETYIGKYEAITEISDLPSARPKEERIAIGAVCEVICKHCIKANGCCQHHWKCPLLTEIAELIESKDEPQTIIGERFPSYITENNAQVLDGWQANPRTSTTAVEDEPQTVLEAVLERQTDEDRRKLEESIRKAIKDEQSGKE